MTKDMNAGKSGKKITRKEAIKKVGVTALTTASILFLQTKLAAADSITASPSNVQTTNQLTNPGNSVSNSGTERNSGRH